MSYSHIPVLLHEVIYALRVAPDKTYIDCTFGGGGYSIAIAEIGASVLGLDIDSDAIHHFQIRTDIVPAVLAKIVVIQANFDSVFEQSQRVGLAQVDGVVFDLGVSSFQLDTAEKGFSFMRAGPIDMRMDPRTGISAGKLLDILDENSLTELFIKFSDEIHSRRIAKAVVIERVKAVHGAKTGYWEHKTTKDLAEFIEKNVPGPRGRIHPATRVFQALRMAVNDEAGNLDRGLRSAWDCLGHGGRLVAVSFHSVEDRIVKSFMKDREENFHGKIIGDIITASDFELSINNRSRSAKMRVIEKL